MARSWLIDVRGLAKKVKGATQSPAVQIKDCGAIRECPNCQFQIDNSDVLNEWPGLPVGVKFDPSDAQLLAHLAGKCGADDKKPHMFIDEFIPTLEGDKGICYTHPENLPGAKKDGNSIHFFHQTTNAYATGQRKRRRIHSQDGTDDEFVRWHKTGKTKAVMDHGVQKGCKKIMVLYRSSRRKGTNSKPDKSNWVMHQYHLGVNEDEKEGEYVVSKIFYQQMKPSDAQDADDKGMIRTSPRTPMIKAPNPPRPGNSPSERDDPLPLASVLKTEVCLAGESQELDAIDESLLCREMFDSCAPLNDLVVMPDPLPCPGLDRNRTNFLSDNNNEGCSIADLENLEFDTPPDFQLSDLQFSSQDSIFGFLDFL